MTVALEGMHHHFIYRLRLAHIPEEEEVDAISSKLVAGGQVTWQSRQVVKYRCSHLGKYSLPETILDSGKYWVGQKFSLPYHHEKTQTFGLPSTWKKSTLQGPGVL